jgi:hypothetical protein
MGYSGETNDINFSNDTTAFYGFLGFLINGQSTNGAGLSEGNERVMRGLKGNTPDRLSIIS